MKIGIIGSGNVGSALGQRWAAAGHDINNGALSTAKPELVALLQKVGARASAGSVAEAASFGKVIVLTTPWNGTQAAIESAGNLAGKIVGDCTNPLEVRSQRLEHRPRHVRCRTGGPVGQGCAGGKVLQQHRRGEYDPAALWR